MTTQDFVKRIDLTGLTDVDGTSMDQLIDAATVASDKGLRIVTTDTALNVPSVPNPNVELEGITPDYWSRYKWVRKPFPGSGGSVKEYNWNTERAADETLLHWELYADLGTLTADVANALNLATEANTNSVAANTAATAALNTATSVETDVGLVESDLTALTTRIATVETNLASTQLDVYNNQTDILSLRTQVNTVNAKLLPLIWILRDKKVSGSAGGAGIAGGWKTRDLNIIDAQSSSSDVSVVLATNNFTLAAGTYELDVVCPTYSAGPHKCALYNETAATYVAYGSSSYSPGGGSDSDVSQTTLKTILTLATSKTFSIKHYITISTGTQDFGVATSIPGVSEYYTSVKITKLPT